MQHAAIPSQSHRLCRGIFYLLMLGLLVPLLTSCSSERTIVNGLDEREANEIIVFLATKGIEANKMQSTGGTVGTRVVTYDIEVNSDKAIEAMSLLNQAGLPRRQSQNLLGVFSNVGLVPSEMEQKVRYQAGLADQIANSIRKIDGVLDAEVLISFPQENPLNPGQTKGKITASVFVKHNGVLDNPNSHLMSKIKRLVASSVTGLDYDNVTVIPVRARESELTPLGAPPPEIKNWTSVWSVVLAQDSVTRFRIIFFSFCVVILLLALLIVWLGWKIHPVLKDHGGFKELFHLQPLQIKEKPPEEAPVEEGTTEAEGGEEDKGLVDKDIDET